jgi:hypothetical protein
VLPQCRDLSRNALAVHRYPRIAVKSSGSYGGKLCEGKIIDYQRPSFSFIILADRVEIPVAAGPAAISIGLDVLTAFF